LNLLNRAAARHAEGHAALRGILDRQQRALDSMSALLASVLDISKLDSGAVVPAPVPSALNEVLDRLRSDFEPLAADKGLELVIERSVEAAHTDPELLRRLLGNLLSNAIRYTHRGSVRVVCARADQNVFVEVRDTGIGIPPEELERIFEEFYQVDRGTQRPEGLGLGLSIVRRLAALLECPVNVTSTIGEGTTFRVTLKRVEAPAGEAAALRDAGQLLGGRILIIDDEPEVAEAIAMLLELEGFTIGVASCEREALERAREHAPDVLVSDYHLRGGETGAGVVAAVRAQLRATVPVVFLTGDTARSALGGAQIDSARILNKPVRADELLAAVREHLASRCAA
jgi:CheY-like chemotaxis protein/anti-sigma regulatory factor (Ser/Thr protein kinase)